MDKIKGLFGGGDSDAEDAAKEAQANAQQAAQGAQASAQESAQGAKDAAQDAVEGAQQGVNPAVAGAQDAVAGAQGAAQQAAADNPLAGLFGGGEQRAEAEDFVNRVTTGKPAEGYSNEEALAQFQKVAQNASPEQLQHAAQQAINDLDDDQRAEFAKMLQERAGGVDSLRHRRHGGRRRGGRRRWWWRWTRRHPRRADGRRLGRFGRRASGDILGGLMGGTGGACRQRCDPRRSSAGGGTDIMDMLGGFMSSTAGKAVIGGIAAFATKELLDKK